MYSVYSFRVTALGEVIVHRYKKNLTKTEAKAVKAERLTCKNSIVTYHIVNDSCIDEFMAWAERQAESIKKKYALMQKRFDYAEALAWKGYKCKDIIAYAKNI